MRQINFFMTGLLLILVAASCENDFKYQETIDFEDVELGEEGYYNGSDKSGVETDGSWIKLIKSATAELENSYSESEWGAYWSGFAVSSLTDTLTAGYENQYSTIAGSGAGGSAQFALAYDSAVVYLRRSVDTKAYKSVSPLSVMVTNSTYTYHTLKDGNMFASRFGEGDWYKLIVRGYSESELTGTKEFFLADFRGGKTIIVADWTKVELSGLGEPDRLVFTFDSSDKTAGWMNTPAYACIDNLILTYSEQ